MLVAAVVLALLNPCAAVDKARASGMTDEAIEQSARAQHVPENVIRWAKTHCKRA